MFFRLIFLTVEMNFLETKKTENAMEDDERDRIELCESSRKRPRHRTELLKQSTREAAEVFPELS